MDLICQTCLRSRTGDVLGAKCRTEGCAGVIELAPNFIDLVDVLPEPMTCGRRQDGVVEVDRWFKFKRIDNRVCSFCGSLHPDDFFRLVDLCVVAADADCKDAVGIELSDKPYKIYVRQPGVRNAQEGGIKFYTAHLPRNEANEVDVSDERKFAYSAAVDLSNARFERRLM